MNALADLLRALHRSPEDDTAWLALADCLEEGGELGRAELTRLTLHLRRNPHAPDYPECEERLRALLEAGVAPCIPEVVNSVGIRLALVAPGTFWMGSNGEGDEDEDGLGWPEQDEFPRHKVELSAFYLGVFPVTQEQYERVMGRNPSAFSAGGASQSVVAGLDTRSFPVESLSWEDATEFCVALSQLPEEKAAGRSYELPTEAQWEYACRACTTTTFTFGDVLRLEQANFTPLFEDPGRVDNRLGRPTPVGSYRPNAFGLFDMHGLVYEWCADWYDARYYERCQSVDPAGPGPADFPVLRGGAWDAYDHDCRSAYRHNANPGASRSAFGVRVRVTVR